MPTYTEIEVLPDRIFALDTDTRNRICIMRSVSDLYRYRVQHGNAVYLPITYRDHHILGDIEELLKGRGSSQLIEDLDNVYVRFGYLDENLAALQWVSLITFYRRWCEKAHTKQDDGKLQNICKMLSISKRDLNAPITRSPPPRLSRVISTSPLNKRQSRRN